MTYTGIHWHTLSYSGMQWLSAAMHRHKLFTIEVYENAVIFLLPVYCTLINSMVFISSIFHTDMYTLSSWMQSTVAACNYVF